MEKDLERIDVGLAILAAESESLDSRLKTIESERQGKIKEKRRIVPVDNKNTWFNTEKKKSELKSIAIYSKEKQRKPTKKIKTRFAKG